MAITQAPVVDIPLSASPRTPVTSQAAIDTGATQTQQAVARQQAVQQTIVPRAQSTSFQTVIKQPVVAQTTTQIRPTFTRTPTATIIDNNQDAGLPQTPVANVTTIATGNTSSNIPVRAAAVNSANVAANATSVVNQRITNIINNPSSSAEKGGIQFFDSGSFSSDKDFKYDPGTDTLTLNGKLTTGNLAVSGYANFGQLANISILGGSPGQLLVAQGGGKLSWVTHYSNSNTAQYLTTYSGNLRANIANVSTIDAGNAVVGRAVVGNLTVTGPANLGPANTLTITGGSTGQFLQTDGNGALTWATVSANGNVSLTSEITNGSSNVIVNANSNVTFGVAGQSEVLTITNAGAQANLFTSNNYTLGNSTTTISTSRWMDAMTMSVNPSVLFSASNAFSSIDIHVTANGGNSKQISKMLSVTQGTTTHYSQYGNVTIGNELAQFTMDQTSGNVRLIATPETASRVDYRLVITLYN